MDAACGMNDERIVRLGVAFARQAAAAPAARLCTACVEMLGVSGAGVTIMSGANSGPVCSSDERMSRLEDLQFSLGEGPGRDAYESGEPVAEPDLEHGLAERWPQYTPSALEMGARGIFAFPLNVGRKRIGVLTVYQDTAGDLTVDQTNDSLVVADVLAQTMASIQSQSKPPLLAAELSDTSAHRAEVHQASGMASIQLGIRVEDALARIRAHAYATNQSVAAVAQQVVARTLRLSDDQLIDGPE